MRAALKALLADRRKNAVLIGPGVGVRGAHQGDGAWRRSAPSAAVVLDADALTSFADDPRPLFAAIAARAGAGGAHAA